VRRKSLPAIRVSVRTTANTVMAIAPNKASMKRAVAKAAPRSFTFVCDLPNDSALNELSLVVMNI
jgi:hypothetical protein